MEESQETLQNIKGGYLSKSRMVDDFYFVFFSIQHFYNKDGLHFQFFKATSSQREKLNIYPRLSATLAFSPSIPWLDRGTEGSPRSRSDTVSQPPSLARLLGELGQTLLLPF